MKHIEDILKEKGVYMGKTKGDSMLPMLEEGKDTVVIIPPVFPLKRLDVPLYKRDGKYVLHRIVRVGKNGYTTCGDNRVFLEKGVREEQIIGVLCGFYHGGRYIDCKSREYIAYSKKICRQWIWRVIKRIFEKLKR